MESLKYKIGQKIRVLPKAEAADESSKVGIISYLHISEKDPPVIERFDVIYDSVISSSLNQQEEESEIFPNRIQSLEYFEELSTDELFQFDAITLKEFGNQLFKLKDYQKAIEFYQLSLKVFHQHEKKGVTLSIGTQVLVFLEDIGDYQVGMISSLVEPASSSSSSSSGKKKSSTIKDDDEEGIYYEISLSDENDEEIDIIISEKHLLEVPHSYDDQLLHRSLYSNLSKSYLKRNYKGWTVKYASITLALVRAMISIAKDTGKEERLTQLTQFLIDALYFRCKVFLTSNRPKRAKRDCQELLQHDIKKGKQLETEIEVFKVKKQKDNKKLAKEIAKWIDSALQQQQKNSKESGGQGDIDIAGDSGEEEEEGGRKGGGSHLKRSDIRKPSSVSTSLIRFIFLNVFSSFHLFLVSYILLSLDSKIRSVRPVRRVSHEKC
jgi:tetratricopeptide (TPR) repeat protein